MSVSVPSVEAQNFLKVLKLIDRTILPRRLFLTSDTGQLVLVAEQQCAALESDRASIHLSSLESVTAAIEQLCASGRPLTYSVEPISPAPAAQPKFSAIAIVNAQTCLATGQDGQDPGNFRFAKNGWPLMAPPEAPYASLEAATRIAWAMSGWQRLPLEKGDAPVLILAVSDSLDEDLSVSIEGDVAIVATPPSLLGRLILRWRDRRNGNENEKEGLDQNSSVSANSASI